MLAFGASTDQVDEIARMGKPTTLENLVRFCDAIETLYTRDYLRKPMPRDLQKLLQKAEARGFPGMIGSIDYMYGQWENYQLPSKEIMGIKKGEKVLFWKPLLHSIHGFGMPFRSCWILKQPERATSIPGIQRCVERSAAHTFDEEVLHSIMMTCIILHNMIVEDEYDYNTPEVFEPDPMNTTFTRIYERPMGANGQPLEHELLVRDGRSNNYMIDRYTEMQSSYIHERRQVGLMEHLWVVRGNDGE
ncbi:uncharacterized protein LOC117630290 [Prunus dulcis]|uniref:uncharacterized protein LOC117630290 n=1 Tax=Prunus dulcis TaxID=3755 RepID=UPI001483615C|nr:uncharacterized protein LOC117630290 [Prunus dulcis]